jgi:hypothetical protein
LRHDGDRIPFPRTHPSLEPYFRLLPVRHSFPLVLRRRKPYRSAFARSARIPKRVPRKIRYACPVACQGEPLANWLPPRPTNPRYLALTCCLPLPYRLRFHMDLRLSPPSGGGSAVPSRRRPSRAKWTPRICPTHRFLSTASPFGKCSSSDFGSCVVLLICFSFRSRGGRLSVVA